MLSFNVVRCPHPLCSTHQEGMCGVPPFQYKFFCAVSPPCNSVPLPHLALSWILSKVENLASSSLQDEATNCFFTELLGPSLIINLAQLVSPSVALPAELVFMIANSDLNQSNYNVSDSFKSVTRTKLCKVNFVVKERRRMSTYDGNS